MENRSKKNTHFVFGELERADQRGYVPTDEFLQAIKLKKLEGVYIDRFDALAKASLFTADTITKFSITLELLENDYLENLRKAGEAGFKAGEAVANYIRNTTR